MRNLFIISGPSGSGKTTLFYKILERFDIDESISYTTRKPRDGEIDGVDYFFINEDEFRSGIDSNRWIEWAVVHGYYYGTCKDFILNSKKDTLMILDVQGAENMKENFECTTIFIDPCSLDVLRDRIKDRGNIEERIKNAKIEMSKMRFFDYVVKNENNKLDEALENLSKILR